MLLLRIRLHLRQAVLATISSPCGIHVESSAFPVDLKKQRSVERCRSLFIFMFIRRREARGVRGSEFYNEFSSSSEPKRERFQREGPSL